MSAYDRVDRDLPQIERVDGYLGPLGRLYPTEAEAHDAWVSYYWQERAWSGFILGLVLSLVLSLVAGSVVSFL